MTPTVTELVMELRTLEAKAEAAKDDDDATALLDACGPLSDAINATPAMSIAELRLKFDLLLHWQEQGEGWFDDRDHILVASIRQDFDRLLKPRLVAVAGRRLG